ncbi:MAG TPA: SigE family RNA polymerase sigma factor [Micromonosporaceae bacterium]|jgi:RNA polymerase sigma-70 factor (sigma-E family)
MKADEQKDYVDFVSARLAQWHKTAYLLCGDSVRADDIVQATVTLLYRHWRRASAADNIDAYVHRILVRQFLNERRAGWARVLLMSRTPDHVVTPEDRLGDQEIVMTALKALAPGQRAVLVLRFLCDLSVEDTAEALHCSPGNVKAQTSRALAAIRTRIPPPPGTTNHPSYPSLTTGRPRSAR